MGFIIGVLAGAVAALLYAPKTGDITRDELKMRSEELKRRADDASVKGRELIDEAKKQWDSSAAGRATTGSRSTPGGSAKQD
jgi:gas vesicle protein